MTAADHQVSQTCDAKPIGPGSSGPASGGGHIGPPLDNRPSDVDIADYIGWLELALADAHSIVEMEGRLWPVHEWAMANGGVIAGPERARARAFAPSRLVTRAEADMGCTYCWNEAPHSRAIHDAERFLTLGLEATDPRRRKELTA